MKDGKKRAYREGEANGLSCRREPIAHQIARNPYDIGEGAREGEARQAASRRRTSVSNSKRNCAASSSGSQFVICGKTVRQ